VITFKPVLVVVLIVMMLVSKSMGVLFMIKAKGVLVMVLAVLVGCHHFNII
jgi:hypothetical protein